MQTQEKVVKYKHVMISPSSGLQRIEIKALREKQRRK